MKQLNELVHLNGRNDVHNQDSQEPGNGGAASAAAASVAAATLQPPSIQLWTSTLISSVVYHGPMTNSRAR